MLYNMTITLADGSVREIRVLIDSGATRNMVAAKLAKLLVLECLEGAKRTRFQFANGTFYTGKERARGVQLSAGEYSTKLDLLVCDLATVDVVLGQEWLCAENPTIDWVTGTVSLREPETASMASADATAQPPPAPPSAGQQSTSSGQPGADGAGASQPQQDNLKARVEPISAAGMRRLLKKPGMLAQAAFALPKERQRATATSEDGTNAGGTSLADVLRKFQHLFEEPDLPPARPEDHKIRLEPGTQPPFKRPFRLSPEERIELRKQLEALLAKELIRPSASPYGAPVLFARKKDGTLRLCIDYRGLNKATIRDKYPLPNISDILDQVVGSKWFSKLDLKSGYHQLRMAEEDVEKTAFVTHLGAYEWVVMPMGLTNAPPSFQRLMNGVLKPCQRFAIVYLDDILIFSATKEEHVKHVEAVLSALSRASLKLNRAKCEFGVNEVVFLGHLLKDGQVAMEPLKVAAVKDWALPTTKRQLQQFLGFCNFYRKFIRDYAGIAAPLTDVLRGLPDHAALPRPLSPRVRTAFEALKAAIVSAPVLRLLDAQRTLLVKCDMSDDAVSACLHQIFEDGEHPVAFASKRLTPAEVRYPARDRELLAVMYALQQWRVYLQGRKFQLFSDHESLQFLESMDLSVSKGRLARWAEKLADFDYDIRHVAGKNNVADPLTHKPTVPAEEREREMDTLIEEATAVETRASVEVPGTDLATLATDPYFGPILEVAQGHRGPKTAVEQQRASRFRLSEAGDALWLMDLSELGRPLWRRCVGGQQNQEHLIAQFHHPRTGGHQGGERTLAAITEAFFFPHMAKRVRKFVAACDSCLRVKPDTSASAPLQPIPVPAAPGQVISMDFLEVPQSLRGHDNILTIVDKFSKMVKVLPTIKEITAEQAAELVLNVVLTTFARLPEAIVSDRDPRFTSILWTALWDALGVKLKMTTAHRPQGDGQSERANRQILEYLRSYANVAGSDWDAPTALAQLEFALNSKPSAATGVSPFEAVNGRAPVAPAALGQPTSLPAGPVSAKFLATRDRLREAEDRMLSSEGKKATVSPPFRVGDKVMLSTRNYKQLRETSAGKLAAPFIGPFLVKRVLSPSVLELDLPARFNIHRSVNVDQVKRYNSDSSAAPGAPSPAPGPARDAKGKTTDLFLIDKILRARQRKGHPEYLVRWLGYSSDWDSWEPESSLRKTDALRDFKLAVPATKRRSPRTAV